MNKILANMMDFGVTVKLNDRQAYTEIHSFIYHRCKGSIIVSKTKLFKEHRNSYYIILSKSFGVNLN